MIVFPKPLDWFQKKIWRIHWIEWSIIISIFWINELFTKKGADPYFFLGIIPLALVFTFTWKYFFIYPLKLMSLIPGFGIVGGAVVAVLEFFAKIIGGINKPLISNFCEEKPISKKSIFQRAIEKSAK